MKLHKLVAAGAAAATMLSMAGGAFAFWGMPMMPKATEIEVENEDMFVMTKTDSYANSGWNDQSAKAMWGGDVMQSLTTGVATSNAFSTVGVGITTFPSCDCFSKTNIDVENEDFHVMTFTDSMAKTGGNDQWGYAKSWKTDVSQTLRAGNAGSWAQSDVTVGYTNFNVTPPTE